MNFFKNFADDLDLIWIPYNCNAFFTRDAVLSRQNNTNSNLFHANVYKWTSMRLPVWDGVPWQRSIELDCPVVVVAELPALVTHSLTVHHAFLRTTFTASLFRLENSRFKLLRHTKEQKKSVNSITAADKIRMRTFVFGPVFHVNQATITTKRQIIYFVW